MSQFEVLDSVAHAKLKIKVQYGEEFRDKVNQTIVFPTEFQSLQREYPIFLRQSEGGKFYAVVLLGLDKDENLFLESGQWNARYVPAVQMKGPFALEVRETPGVNPQESDPRVVIDMADSRVNQESGENVFLSHGGYSLYFEETLQVLRRIHLGSTLSDSFFSHLQSFDLIEPVTVQAKFGETKTYTVPDVFTISQSRMAELTAAELHTLNGLGLLEHCYAIISSAGNMSRLVDMKALRTNPVI